MYLSNDGMLSESLNIPKSPRIAHDEAIPTFALNSLQNGSDLGEQC